MTGLDEMTITRPGFSGAWRKWVQVANYIIDRIESGDLPKFTAGGPPETRKAIPDMDSLCRKFGVSDSVTRHAYRYLTDAGIITRGSHGYYMKVQAGTKVSIQAPLLCAA